MGTWLTPIFDRTQADVGEVLTKISQWMAEGSIGQIPDMKGCLNASDLNRIEANTLYLSERLSELGYEVEVSTKTWDKQGLPTEEDVKRIIANIQTIEIAFHNVEQSIRPPTNMTRYDEINALEEILYRIKFLLDAMISSFKKSNTFQSGKSFVLPIRR